MNLLQIVNSAGSFMKTNGDVAHFEVVNSKLIAKFIHKGIKRSFTDYGNGTIVETIVHKVISK